MVLIHKHNRRGIQLLENTRAGGMGEDEFEAWLTRDIRSWGGILGDRKKSKINYADIQ